MVSFSLTIRFLSSSFIACLLILYLIFPLPSNPPPSLLSPPSLPSLSLPLSSTPTPTSQNLPVNTLPYSLILSLPFLALTHICTNITAHADTYKYIQTNSNTYRIIYLKCLEQHRTYAQISYVLSHQKARFNDLIVFD